MSSAKTRPSASTIGTRVVPTTGWRAAIARARASAAVISGPSCVIDGNTLQVGSKLRDGKCWGGIDVRLHGSKAPTSDETCSASDGNKWACGEAAKNALRTMVRQHAISCFHIDGEFEDNIPVVTCLSGRRDLAMEMVRQGMAKALHDQSNRYELEETDAKRKKRGLWQ